MLTIPKDSKSDQIYYVYYCFTVFGSVGILEICFQKRKLRNAFDITCAYHILPTIFRSDIAHIAHINITRLKFDFRLSKIDGRVFRQDCFAYA